MGSGSGTPESLVALPSSSEWSWHGELRQGKLSRSNSSYASSLLEGLGGVWSRLISERRLARLEQMGLC